MGRIVVPLTVSNALDRERTVRFDALVDTGAYGLTLPRSWRPRFGALPLLRSIELETADGRTIVGEVCGPVIIHIDGFDVISGEVTFIDAGADESHVEPLLGHIVLQASRAAVDLAHDRLVHVRYLDLKRVA